MRFFYVSVLFCNLQKIKLLGRNVQIFCFFFQNPIFSSQQEVFPLFLRNGFGRSDWIVLQVVRLNWDVCFLNLLEISFLSNLAAFTKIIWLKKSRYSVFCFSCPPDSAFFKEKTTHPVWVLVTTKKFSSNVWTFDFCDEENFWWLSTLVTSETHRRRHLGILIRPISAWEKTKKSRKCVG